MATTISQTAQFLGVSRFESIIVTLKNGVSYTVIPVILVALER
jgi:hypothetical protein